MSGHGSGWANPAPAGLVALGVAGLTFYALLSGSVSAGALPLLGCWLMGGALVQFTVGVIELKEGALVGGNVFLFFSGFFMLAGALEMFVKYFAAAYKFPIPLDAHIDGYAWIILSIALIFLTPVYMKSSNTVMGLILILLTPAAILVALMDGGWIGATPWKPIAAYLLGGVGLLGVYMASAIWVNSTFGRTIMPTGSPMIK